MPLQRNVKGNPEVRYHFKELKDAVLEYQKQVKDCKEVASVAGFCVFLGRSKRTVTKWATDKTALYNSLREGQDKPEYEKFMSDDVENPLDLAFTIIEAALNERKDAMAIAQCNTYFKYDERDKTVNKAVVIEMPEAVKEYAC